MVQCILLKVHVLTIVVRKTIIPSNSGFLDSDALAQPVGRDICGATSGMFGLWEEENAALFCPVPLQYDKRP
jgi:hypothetical protein